MLVPIAEIRVKIFNLVSTSDSNWQPDFPGKTNNIQFNWHNTHTALCTAHFTDSPAGNFLDDHKLSQRLSEQQKNKLTKKTVDQ